jgi:glutathione S-transferase
MSSEKYQLYYFGVPGLAANIRTLFHVAGVEYENIILTGETFGELKKSGFLPYGKVPVLVKGDFKLGESIPITKYLGKQFGLWPESEEDSAVALSVLTSLVDIGPLFWAARNAKDDSAEGKLKIAVEKFVAYERAISNLLGEKKFLFGEKLTAVDVAIFNFLTSLVTKELINEKNILNFLETVASDERIASYKP